MRRGRTGSLIGAQNSDNMQDKAFYLGNVGRYMKRASWHESRAERAGGVSGGRGANPGPALLANWQACEGRE